MNGHAAMLLGLLILPAARVVAIQARAVSPANSTAAQNSPQRDLEVLRRLEEEYLRAEIEDDTAIAGTILADDFVGLRADGTSSSKVDVLNRLGRQERRREPYLITATNMRQHLFGDTACVTYTKVYTKPGSQNSYSENVLHLLIRRDGIWRLQLSSPLPNPRPQGVSGSHGFGSPPN